MLKKFAENKIAHILLVAVVAFTTFLPVLDMFFYLDEWGALYDFTHKDYVYSTFTTNNYYILYSWFKLNAAGYYFVGTLIYALSAVLFYIFASGLLKNKMLGLIAALLYATSPVGSNTATIIWTYVAEGGYPLTIMLLMLLYLFWRYFTEKKLVYFVLVTLGFLFFAELEPRRVFIFFPILFLFDYILSNKRYIPTLGFIARQIVLFVSFVAYYRYDVTLSELVTTGKILIAESSPLDGGAKLELAIQSLIHMKPLLTLTNILLGGPWLFLSTRLTGYVDVLDVKQTYLLVIATLVIAIGLVILAWRQKKEWGLLSLFALGWMHVNVLGIYIFSSPGISDIQHRTLSLAAPAYGLFFTVSGLALYTFLKKKEIQPVKYLNRIFIIAFLLFAGSNMSATHYNFNKFTSFHSKPARSFFVNLKNYYPTLSAGSLIYIETPNSPAIKYQLSRVYGGSPYGGAASITAFYPEIKKEELKLVYKYGEVEEFIGKDKSKIDRVFAFYFDSNGLRDTTSDIRNELQNKK